MAMQKQTNVSYFTQKDGEISVRKNDLNYMLGKTSYIKGETSYGRGETTFNENEIGRIKSKITSAKKTREAL